MTPPLRREHGRRRADHLDLRANQRDDDLLLANQGVAALDDHPGFRAGLNVAGGEIAYAPVAEALAVAA